MSLLPTPQVSAFAWRELVALALILALTVLPVSLAARMASARRPGLVWSVLAVFVGGIVAQIVLATLGATLVGAALSFLALCAVFAVVLDVPLIGAIGVAVLAYLLQILIAYALARFGLHVHGLPR